MQALDAKVMPVAKGQETLKDGVDAPLEAYFKEYKTALCCIGSAVAPAPYSKIIRDLQQVVGRGSNSTGLFSGFISNLVDLVKVEAMGRGSTVEDNATTSTLGKKWITNSFINYILQDSEGKTLPTHTIATGLTNPGVGPRHASLKDGGRAGYVCTADKEDIGVFFTLNRSGGIIPTLRSAHAVAYAIKHAKSSVRGSVLVNLSGRGDKDIEHLKNANWFPEDRKECV